MPAPYICSMKNMCRSTALGATAFTARSTGKYEFYLTMASLMPLTESVLPDMSAEWTTERCRAKAPEGDCSKQERRYAALDSDQACDLAILNQRRNYS